MKAMVCSVGQRDYWNAVAETKAFSHPLDWRRFEALVDRSARILDYGCGYGRIAGQLHAAGYAGVMGVDPSPGMIMRARAEHPELSFDVLDGAAPFADASFDAVVMFSVLTCIPSDEGQREVVREIGRLLRPNGIVYVSDILLQDDDRNRARYDRMVPGPPYGVFELEPGVVFRHLTRARIGELFTELTPIAIVELPVTTMNGNAARGFQYVGRKERAL
jgi:SAM-dependent methyltransferase